MAMKESPRSLRSLRGTDGASMGSAGSNVATHRKLSGRTAAHQHQTAALQQKFLDARFAGRRQAQTNEIVAPKEESFFDQTVTDLQQVFHALHVWANSDSTAQQEDLEKRPNDSLDCLILAPWKCEAYKEIVEGENPRQIQQNNNFLVAKWETNASSGQSIQATKSPSALKHLFSSCAFDDALSFPQDGSVVLESVLNHESFADDYTLGEISILNSVEEEELQIRRLTSWGTNATNETFGTTESRGSLLADGDREGCVDDNGTPIDPVLLEKSIASSRQRNPRRKRVVRFEYPPVSSFRQCERLEKEDLSKLFFSEEELDQYEDDRYQTAVADDIEVVAVAPSQDRVPPQPADDQSPETPAKSNFSKTYVPTPRKVGGSARRNRRAGTPQRDRSQALPPSPEISTAPRSPKSPRLVKSVQIFLRERSTGSRTEER